MRYVLLAAGLALHAPAVAAQSAVPQPGGVPASGDPATPGAPITEDEFLAAALADPVLRSTLADIGAEAEGRRRAAGLLSNPAVEADHESPGDTRQTTATLSWRPPLDGQRGLEVAAADAAVEAADRHREMAELELRLALRSAFADWALADLRTRLVDRERARVEELARQAEERANRGEESGLNARRIRFAAVELASEGARERADAAVVRGAVAALVSFDPDRLPTIPDLPEVALPDSADSPALAALRAERARAELEERRAGRFLVFPEVFAGWQWQDVPGADADGPVFGLSWDLPLFDRGQADRVRSARTAVAARAREELATRRLEAAQSSRLAAYDTLRQAALAAREATGPADATIEAVVAAYGYGETTMTDLLDTIRTVLAGRLAALELHAAALAAHRELERAAGRPLPR